MSESREFFFHIKGFSGSDVYHSDVKMRACTVKTFFFYSLKFFFKISKSFFDQMLDRLKLFCLNCEKM